MADEFFIIKDDRVEQWSDDWAIGTMIVSGVASEVAISTVRTARKLFRELGARSIGSKAWVVLSEEIRRGNLGTAAAMVAKLPKVAPAAGEAPSAWSAEVLHAQIAETLARSHRTDSYAHVQHNEAFYVRTLASASPALALVAARANELADVITLRAGREVLPQILEACFAVAAEVPGGVPPEALADLKARMYALTAVNPLVDVARLDRELAALCKRALAANVLAPAALGPALDIARTIFCPIPPILFTPDPVAPSMLTPEEVEEYRTRPRMAEPGQMPPGDFARPRLANPPPKPDDDPRDKPPPAIYGEEIDPDMAYVRWTTVEWRPFIRPDDHDMFCWRPLRDATGDRVKLADVGAGSQLVKCSDVLALRHITKVWADEVEGYWPPDDKRRFIPTQPFTWVDMFVVDTKDTDEESDFVKDVERRIREQLDKDATREKLEKLIEDGIDKLAGGIEVFGVKVGPAAALAGKLIASATIKFAEWLVDQVFATNAFQIVLVTHKTMMSNGRLKSWVTWGTTDRDSGEAAAYDPRFDDARDSSLKVRRLSDRREYNAVYDLGVAGIHWESESDLPTLLPQQINKLFLLQNANFGEIYWPTSSLWGGHVFLPIRSRTGDATYCLALRTEVRAVHLDTP